jgi:hypothetical protein
VRLGVGGSVTSFEYDGGGRRVRESGAGLERRYRWDELGRLTEVAAGGDGDARAVDVVVDALGELASVDGTPLLWDSAHPLSPVAWNGEASVLGEDGPSAQPPPTPTTTPPTTRSPCQTHSAYTP